MDKKHWYDRPSVELIDLKEGDSFYMPDTVSFLPYKLLKLPKDNGLMCYCETPSGNKNYYYGSNRVVKQNLFDQFLQSRGYDLPQYLLGGKTLHECNLAIYE